MMLTAQKIEKLNIYEMVALLEEESQQALIPNPGDISILEQAFLRRDAEESLLILRKLSRSKVVNESWWNKLLASFSPRIFLHLSGEKERQEQPLIEQCVKNKDRMRLYINFGLTMREAQKKLTPKPHKWNKEMSNWDQSTDEKDYCEICKRGPCDRIEYDYRWCESCWKEIGEDLENPLERKECK